MMAESYDYGHGDYRQMGFSERPNPQQNLNENTKPTIPREPSKVQVFIEGLPLNVQVNDVVKYFSTVGKVKLDRETRNPRVWLYKNKNTGDLTGEATVTYVDRESQKLAIQSFHGKLFMNRYILKVSPAIVKCHMADPPILPPRPSRGMPGRGRGPTRGGTRGRGNSRGNVREQFLSQVTEHSSYQPYGIKQDFSSQRSYSNY